MTLGNIEFELQEPASITREAIKQAATKETFVQRYFLGRLSRREMAEIQDPNYFDAAVTVAYAELRRRLNNRYVNELAENAMITGRQLSPDWVERTEALVEYVQRDLRFEIFKALCWEAVQAVK